MNRTHLWKFLVIVFVVCWAIYEGTPPVKGDLLAHFDQQASNKDDTFNAILEQARAAYAAPDNKATDYAVLKTAIGTNRIAHFTTVMQISCNSFPLLFLSFNEG